MFGYELFIFRDWGVGSVSNYDVRLKQCNSNLPMKISLWVFLH